MISPYDWQQSIFQRAEYIEARLRGGSPIVGLAIQEGALLYTYRRNVRKVYEVYDRIMFAAMGQQADVENMRVTAVDFAHAEGYQRSEADVTGGRVVGFALSAPLKRAYGDITSAPFVIRAIFAELDVAAEKDTFYALRYDGDFTALHRFAVVAGTADAEERMCKVLTKKYKEQMSLDAALKLADEVWRIGADVDGNGEPDPALIEDSRPEIGILERDSGRERRFRLLNPK